MDRYKETQKVAGKYYTSKLPLYEIRDTDLYIFSREGDRLDSLANSFYSDPTLWWIIANANNLGKGSLMIPPGIQLRIPNPIDDIRERLETIEKER